EYGIFKQSMRNGWQQEEPDNWLRRTDPWEVARPQETVEFPIGCGFELRGGSLRVIRDQPSTLIGVPYDRPVVGYGGKTDHTLLPEALEKWPRAWFEVLLPRHLEIVREINRRLLDDVQARFPGDGGRVARVSLMEEGTEQKVRMANLAIVGSHSTNGVAAIHSRLLRTVTVRDLAEQFPARFNNKTNGVTPRRWLLLANPVLARAITAAIGESWITELGQLRRLAPLADDRGFRDAVRKAKREAKTQFAGWLRSATGQAVDPETIFDCQVKRI